MSTDDKQTDENQNAEDDKTSASFVDKDIQTQLSSDDAMLIKLLQIDPELAEKKLAIDELKARIALNKSNTKANSVPNNMFNEESWMKTYWRPAAGWIYLLICVMDFVVFPLLAMIMPLVANAFGIQITYQPWEALTLSNGGLIHLAFGAILGIAAWTRGSEKIEAMRSSNQSN